VRIGIDLDQPDAVVLVYQEVKSEQLVGSWAVLRIQRAPGTKKCIDDDILHSQYEIALDVHFTILICFMKVLLKVIEAKGVAFLEKLVLVGLVLEALVRQVNVIVLLLQIVIV